jgi:hypothetical protein
MIRLSKLRDLDLAHASAKGRPAHLSAASGLVRVGDSLYVVADDELHLGVFPASGDGPGRLVRVFEGELPGEKSARKRAKPDLEALVELPATDEFPHGALLAIGSGSTPDRGRGALIGLDASGGLRGPHRAVDLWPLLEPLADEFADLNIEGAVVAGGELSLLQRGNRQHPNNAVAAFEVDRVLKALRAGDARAIPPISIRRFRLDSIDGVPLTVTDGAALPDGSIVFSAVAEATDDAYHDGACVGAAVGALGADGAVRYLEHLDLPYKIEGIHGELRGRRLKLLAVTDADDVAVPASLFAATIELAAYR